MNRYEVFGYSPSRDFAMTKLLLNQVDPDLAVRLGSDFLTRIDAYLDGCVELIGDLARTPEEVTIARRALETRRKFKENLY